MSKVSCNPLLSHDSDCSSLFPSSLLVAALPSCLRVTAWAFDSSSNSAPAPKSSIFSPVPANSISDPSSPSSSSFSPKLKARPEDSSSRHQGDGRSMLVSDSLPSPPSTAPASPTSTSAPIPVGGSEEGEAVILALEHTSLPFWGVQFHPESVESNGGTRMIRNFLEWVEKWWIERSESNEEANSKVKSWERRESLASRLRDLGGECVSLGTTSRAISNPMELNSRSWSIVSRRFKKEEMPNKESASQVFDSLFRFGGSRSSSSKIERGVGSVWLDSARVSFIRLQASHFLDLHLGFSSLSSLLFLLTGTRSQQSIFLHGFSFFFAVVLFTL